MRPWSCGRCGSRRPGTVVAQAERAEQLGWDGITFTDSQNLVGDPFVAVALAAAATERLRFATGVTNAFTRHPGRARQRRGDGAGDVGRPLRARHRPRRHRAVPPRPQADAGRRRSPRAVTDLQTYLAQRDDRLRRPPEPHAVARPLPPAEGPARHRGVRPADDRVRGAHRRAGHARGRRRSRPGRVGARPRPQGRGRRRPRSRPRSRSARTSTSAAIPTSTRPARSSAAASPRSPTSRRCPARPAPASPTPTATSSPRSAAATTATSTSATRAAHTDALTPEFVDRFAVVGPPDGVRRPPPRARRRSGVERFVITGASFGADREHARDRRAAAAPTKLLPGPARASAHHERPRSDHPRRHRRRRHRRAGAHRRRRDRRRRRSPRSAAVDGTADAHDRRRRAARHARLRRHPLATTTARRRGASA